MMIINDKYSDVLGIFLLRYDIILLCETWISEDSKYELNGFKYYNYPRKIMHQNAKRSSGGLGIFVRKNIAQGVTVLKHTKGITAWIKLDKDFFGLTTDTHMYTYTCIRYTYVGSVYCVAAGSTHLIDDPFDILLQDISQLPES